MRFVANQVAAVLRNRRFVGLAELNEAIFDEVASINARPFQKREDSRQIVFVRDEKPLLIPLAHVRFELTDLRKAKAGTNYHVQVDSNFYSVPAKLIGQSLDVRITSHIVEIFDGTERVASHPRRKGVRGRYSTVTSHMPEAHRSRLIDWTPQRFEQWAATVGPNTVTVINAILASRKIVEQSFRSCLGVIGYYGRREPVCRCLVSHCSGRDWAIVTLWAEPGPRWTAGGGVPPAVLALVDPPRRVRRLRYLTASSV